MQLNFTIHPRRIGLVLGTVALLLACQSLISEYMIENILASDYDNPVVLVIDLFSVNAEETIPTWFSTLLLFIAAVLLTLITGTKWTNQASFKRYWFGLAIIFLYLSMDEGAVIHEILSDPLQVAFNTTGFLSFGWQVVAIPVVIFFGLIYLRFLMHLPARTRNLFVVAGVVYVGGALVVESISANQWYLSDGVTFDYLAIATIEELFEMLGIVVFIYALLAYLVRMQSVITIQAPRVTAATAAEVGVTIAPSAGNRYRRPLLMLLLVSVILIGMNATLLSWALATSPTVAAVLDTDRPLTDTLFDELAGEGVLLTRVPGPFWFDKNDSSQIAKTYIELFAEVMVVSLPTTNTTILIAGDTLPFDQKGLTEILQANGLTQFVIFDAEAVQQLVRNS